MGTAKGCHLSGQGSGGNQASPCWDCTVYRRNCNSLGSFALALGADVIEETSNAKPPEPTEAPTLCQASGLGSDDSQEALPGFHLSPRPPYSTPYLANPPTPG